MKITCTSNYIFKMKNFITNNIYLFKIILILFLECLIILGGVGFDVLSKFLFIEGIKDLYVGSFATILLYLILNISTILIIYYILKNIKSYL